MAEKCFRDLGVSENITLDELGKAYQKKVRDYKCGDYFDDEIYLRKKLEELAISYHQALNIIKNSRNTEGEEDFSNSKDTSNKPKYETFKRQLGKNRLFASDEFDDSRDPTDESKGFLRKLRTLKENVRRWFTDEKKKTAISVGSSVLAISVSFWGVFVNADAVSSDESESDSDVVIYEEEVAAESDKPVTQVDTNRVGVYIGNLEHKDTKWTKSSNETIAAVTDEFAKAYFNYDTIQELNDALCNSYDDYDESFDDSSWYCMIAVTKYWGLPSYHDVLGAVNPFNEEIVNDEEKYVRLLIEYQENMGDI